MNVILANPTFYIGGDLKYLDIEKEKIGLKHVDLWI